MSSTIPSNDEANKANAAAPVVPPTDVGKVEEKVEISNEEIEAKFEELSGITGLTMLNAEDQLDELDAVIAQEIQAAGDYVAQLPHGLYSPDAVVPAFDASTLTEGVKHLEVEANGFNKLPNELIVKIFDLALTTNEGIISMPCISDKTFKPNLGTALLQTCKEVYVQARNLLYTSNTVIFDQFGSDLKRIAKFEYSNTADRPVFANVVFDVGDASLDYEGTTKTALFIQALNSMRHDISVDHLKIEFRLFCFDSTITPDDFAAALGHIKVNKLTICGADYLWEDNVRAVPQSLKMNRQPATSLFIPRNEALVNPRPGFFTSTYTAAENVEDITGVEGVDFVDVGVDYQEWCRDH